MSKVSRIAIHLQLPSTQDKAEKTDDVELLWGRIALAACTVVGTLAIIVWVILGTQEKNTATTALHEPITHTPTVDPTDTALKAKEVERPENLDKARTPSHQTTSIQQVHTKPGLDGPRETKSTSVSTNTNPNHLDVTALSDTKETAKETAKATTLRSPPKANRSTKQSTNTMAVTTIYSAHVLSAELSPHINKKTVVEHLTGQVMIAPKEITKVHFVTEYQGLKDQWVYHDWYHKNTRVARIKVRPQQHRLRAFSSKNIDASMTGNWAVKVVTEDNTLLTLGEFGVAVKN